MKYELPKFNQRFVRNLRQDSDEARFVSTVGDAIFLSQSNQDVIANIDFDLRRPIIVNSFDSQTERDAYIGSFSSTFEARLEEAGLEELVVALNGLIVATNSLKGRNLTWTAYGVDEQVHLDEYIIGSQIGFVPNFPGAPAAYIKTAANSYDTDGIFTHLDDMWDMEIHSNR